MISMNMHQAAAVTGGTLAGKPTIFRGISTDSRQDCTGKLFVALQGENFNGEDYCAQAQANGAVALLVSHAVDVNIPQLICEDSLRGLSILGKYWAKQSSAKIIAITGSNGKTTVKNMLFSILSVSHICSATQGNLNNEIGVPLTLCSINTDDEFAVIEMGAAKVGDISHLVSLVDIHTAVLTNVSPAHIGRFENFANIVAEKGQIFSTLNAEDYAVLPFDDEYFHTWQQACQAKIISFGQNQQADVTLDAISDVQLPVAGLHNRINATCAKAIAKTLNISCDEIKKGLENFTPETGRLQNLGKIDGVIVINDCYNANVQSVKAAIDVLAEYSDETVLIFGDMAELGDESARLHAEIGQYAKSKNISQLLTIGQDSKFAAQAFGEKAQHFKDKSAIKPYLWQNWQNFSSVLVKGSRSMQLEDIINAIKTEKVA